MGQKQTSQSPTKKTDTLILNSSKKNDILNPNKHTLNLQRNSFDFLYVIGKGGFGKVKLIFYKVGMESKFQKIKKTIRFKRNVQTKNN